MQDADVQIERRTVLERQTENGGTIIVRSISPSPSRIARIRYAIPIMCLATERCLCAGAIKNQAVSDNGAKNRPRFARYGTMVSRVQ